MEPPKETGVSLPAGRQAGEVPSAYSTSYRPATSARPHRTVLAVFGLFALAVAAVAAWKLYGSWRQYQALRSLMEMSPLRMPEPTAAEPPKEPVGIVADPRAGEDRMRIDGKRTDMPNLEASAQAIRMSREVLPVLTKFADDPLVRKFAQEFKSDPELTTMLERFQKDKNVYGLIKGMHNNAAFQELMGRYLHDPRFQELMRRAQSDPALRSAMPNIDFDRLGSGLPAMDDDGSAAGPGDDTPNPTIDPGRISEPDGGRKGAVAPPPPPPRR